MKKARRNFAIVLYNARQCTDVPDSGGWAFSSKLTLFSAFGRRPKEYGVAHKSASVTLRRATEKGMLASLRGRASGLGFLRDELICDDVGLPASINLHLDTTGFV